MMSKPAMLFLFGPMRLTLPEGGAALRYAKGRALLAYLALHRGQWVARRTLAALLWPKLEEWRALTNLRQVLSPLQRALGTEGADLGLRAERDRLMLDAHEGLFIDAALLISPVPDLSEEAGQARLEALLPAPDQPFLADLRLSDCPEFEEWRARTEAHLRGRHRSLLRTLCEAQCARGRLAAAVQSARQALALDPLDESAVSCLMQLLLQSGDRRAAEQLLAATDQLLVQQLGHRASAALKSLLEAEPPAGVPTTMVASSRWERRHLALLWIHLEADDTNDEGWHDLAERQDAARATAQRWGARCQPDLEGGLLAVFGLHADGEAPEWRALLAARELLGAPRPSGVSSERPLSAALGLECGEQLLRLQGSQWQLMSQEPRRLRQLAAQAQPGELLLGPRAASRLADRILCEGRAVEGQTGTQRWLGLREPRPPSAATFRCVGRELLMQELRLQWQAACRGEPSWVVLRGEAGIGKTTVAASFARALHGGGVLCLSWNCRLEWQHQPLAPLSESLQSLPGPARALLPARLTQMLEGQVLPGPALFDACFAWLDRLSARQPVLLWVDDLHWADQATRELLARYAAWMDRQRLMILVSSRPEVALEVAGAEPLFLEVQPLGEEAAWQLLRTLDAKACIAPRRREAILEAAAGIPLLIESLVRGELEGHPAANGGVMALMQAELDRLGNCKPVLQAAALIGPQFDEDLLSSLLPGPLVQEALQRAGDSGLLLRDGSGRSRFRHALLQEAAAQGAWPAQARAWHARLADLRAERGEAPALLAGHLEGSGQLQAACQAWWAAGQQALRQEFAADAEAALHKAWRLAQAGALEEGLQRHALDLDRVRALQMHEGYGSAQAHALCQQLLTATADGRPDARDLDAAPGPDRAPGPGTAQVPASASALRRLRFVALSRLYMGAGSQGESGGLRVARQLEAAAGTPAERLTACFALGNSLFWRGHFEEARRYQRQGLDLLPGLSAQERCQDLGDDAGVLLLAFHCWTQWFCGDSAGADAAVEQGLALARAEGRNHALCFMLTFVAAMNWTRGRSHAVLRHAGEAQALAVRLGYPLWQGMNSLFLAWARVRTGHKEAVTPVLQAAEQADRAYKAGRSTARWILASTLALLGQQSAARKLLRPALPEAEADEDHYCRPGLLMLLSDCERHAGDWARADALASQACELALEQGAVGWLARHAPALVREVGAVRAKQSA